MQLSDLGEFGLIERIERLSRRGVNTRAWPLGIGDDAALLRPPAGRDLAVSTDAFVEGRHFCWPEDVPRAIGRRAVVASLSDLAAMGARPLGCLLSLAAPPSLEVGLLDGVLRGLAAEARAHACPLVGGNVSAAGETSLTLTVLGHVARGRALTRRGLRPGDRLFVTGVLGAARLARERARRSGGRVRHTGAPRLAAGIALASVTWVGACIDVSDGLDADLDHLLAAAEGGPLAAEVDEAALPRPRGFERACERLGLDPRRALRAGGEDYELLFSLRPGAPGAAALGRRLRVAVREIGRVRSGGAPERAHAGGWRHF